MLSFLLKYILALNVFKYIQAFSWMICYFVEMHVNPDWQQSHLLPQKGHLSVSNERFYGTIAKIKITSFNYGPLTLNGGKAIIVFSFKGSSISLLLQICPPYLPKVKKTSGRWPDLCMFWPSQYRKVRSASCTPQGHCSSHSTQLWLNCSKLFSFLVWQFPPFNFQDYL